MPTTSTTVITSHATMGPIVKIAQDGTILVSRMPYERFARKSLRHIMETGDGSETIMETLRRGVTHEGAKHEESFEVNPMSERPILYVLGPDENNPGGTHLKTIFPVEVTGELRDYEIKDTSKSGVETLGPITMVSAESLLLETEGKTIKLHWQATYAAIEFAMWNPLASSRYTSYVKKWKSMKPVLAPEEEDAVEHYFARQLGQ